MKKLVIVGLATDFCVGNSAVDAVKAGFETIVPLSAVRGIKEDSSEKMVAKLKDMGANIITDRGEVWKVLLRDAVVA